MSVIDRVQKIVIEHLDVDPDKVIPQAKFADLGADSLDHVEMIMSFEEEFEIEIQDDKAAGCDTVQHVVDLISVLAGE